jgi:hypothetical protein
MARAVWRHVIGTPRDQDVKVFQEDNTSTTSRSRRKRTACFLPLCTSRSTSLADTAAVQGDTTGSGSGRSGTRSCSTPLGWRRGSDEGRPSAVFDRTAEVS